MNDIQTLLQSAENFAREMLARKGHPDLVFHTIGHTEQVIASVKEIAASAGLAQKEIDLIVLASWFHDLGYTEIYTGHEAESQKIATAYLQNQGVGEELIAQVNALIEATRLDVEPKNLYEQIIKDADLSNLATPEALAYTDKLRHEWQCFLDQIYTNQEWYEFNLKFYRNHLYYTDYAKEIFVPRKKANIILLEEKLQAVKEKKLRKKAQAGSEKKALEKDLKKKVKKIARLEQKIETIREQKPDRGIETMFRTTYRTHISLSSIADNKANILLSINAIIISIIGSSLYAQVQEHPYMLIPAIIFLTTCLTTIVFAILSTRPSVSSGIFTREDILKKRTNLLFFGNFHRMALDDYLWGMKEMMKDSDYLYGSMSKDIYFLGVVLAKKFKLLRYAYTIFMYGMVLAVVTLALMYALKPTF